MNDKKRMQPDERREHILAAAIDLARTEGYNRIRRDQIAAHANVSMALVTHYFGTMNQCRRAIMRAAIRDEVLEVIGQGLATGDPHARKAPAELKRRAGLYIAENE